MDNMESMGLEATVDRGREDAGRSGDTHVPMADRKSVVRERVFANV